MEDRPEVPEVAITEEISFEDYSEAQQIFHTHLNVAFKRLFSMLDINFESSLTHRQITHTFIIS